MSYPEISNDFLNDLLRRKEFYSLKNDDNETHNLQDSNTMAPSVGQDILNLKYLKVHSHQLFTRNFMSPNSPYKRLHLMHSTGCHAAGTKILMHDLSIKNVEDIIVGDQLMGDDALPRTVLSLARGEQDMYEFVPADYNETYTFNYDHILVLRDNIKRKIITISVREFISNILTYKIKYTDYSLVRAGPTKLARLLARFDINAKILLDLDVINLCLMPPIKGMTPIGKLKSAPTEMQMLYLRVSGLHIITDTLFVYRAIYENSLEYYYVPFEINYRGNGQYYGFALDGNHKFLARDLTIMHNTGKTLAGVVIAQEYITTYQKIFNDQFGSININRQNYNAIDKITPSVFVLGYGGTKAAFIRELLRYPQFGFISPAELDRYTQLQSAASTGGEAEQRAMKEFYSRIKKRITNKTLNGFYKFYGYDTFVNRLFSTDSEIKPVDIENELVAEQRAGNATVTYEELIYKHIKSGALRVNESLVRMFNNSLLICDEVHHTYNTNMKNNRGVAIQYILDSVPNMHLVTMSWTPMNNSPTEIVELLNYLNEDSRNNKIYKRDLFTDASGRAFKPGAEERINKIMMGKISFLQNMNPKYFPEVIFKGEDYKLSSGQMLPYLKIDACPMSRLHQLTINKLINDSRALSNGQDVTQITPEDTEEQIYEEEDAAEISQNGYRIPTDGYALFDGVFPNPNSDEYGLYRSSHIRSEVISASQTWRDQTGINLVRQSIGGIYYTGTFLLRENLDKYFTKYARLYDYVIAIFKETRGRALMGEKQLVYHPRVRTSGVILLQEMFKMNGFVDEYSDPVDNTLCSLCGYRLDQHRALPNDVEPHTFNAARFVVAHSGIQKQTVESTIAHFNLPDNTYGQKYCLMIGSRLIEESYDFKAVRKVYLLSVPVHISSLRQFFGRPARNSSHIMLAPNKRNVTIYILVSVVNSKNPYVDLDSPEIFRYYDKILDYQMIQRIERIAAKNAIDADTNKHLNLSTSVLKKFFPQGDEKEPRDVLGLLYFKPEVEVPRLSTNEVKTDTFTAYRYYEEEIATITFIIRTLFVAYKQVWTYDELWHNVLHPPFHIEVNPKFFNEYNFVIALERLVQVVPDIIQLSGNDRLPVISENTLIDKMTNPRERYIWKNSVKHKIVQMGKYYILFPVVPANDQLSLGILRDKFEEAIRNKQLSLIYKSEYLRFANYPTIDAETYTRLLETPQTVRVNVTNYIRTIGDEVAFTANKESLAARDIDEEESARFNFLIDYNVAFQQKILMEVIEHGRDDHQLYWTIELLDELGAIISVDDLLAHKEIMGHFNESMLKKMKKGAPIGLITEKSVKLWNAHTKKWHEVSKASFGAYAKQQDLENPVIVGFLEEKDGGMKFKLRNPINLSSRATREEIDNRFNERGIVCSTKTKIDLVNILTSLHGHLKIKADKTKKKLRIKSLCSDIFELLVRAEIAEKNGKRKYKYLYSWWDNLESQY